jgi:hypothetical protein
MEYGQRSRIFTYSQKKIVLETGQCFEDREAINLFNRLKNKINSEYIKNFDDIYLNGNRALLKEIRNKINKIASDISVQNRKGKKKSKRKEIQEAIDNGLKTYFTGKPCKNGHIAERRLSTNVCIQCAKEIHSPKDRDNYRDPKNTFKRQFECLRQKCKSKNLPFTINFNDLERPEYCPVFGTKLNYGCSTGIDGKQTRDPNKASIDKLIPELGYIPGNVFIISLRANKLKSNMTMEELKKILKYMENKV